MVMRNMFRFRKEEETILEKITRVLLRVKYYANDEMKKDEIGGTCGTSEEEECFGVET